jgi:hypothetical protein
MNYNFKYKSKFERLNFQEYCNSISSSLLFYLYSNRYFKKLKLDKNEFLKTDLFFEKNRKPFNFFKSKIPENPKLNIFSITFLDCIENEDSSKVKSRLASISSKYKGGFLSPEPSKRIKEAFEKFESDYKTVTFGNLFYNNTKENDNLDLIDGVEYGYVKGADSHFIMTYTVYPSEKFKLLFKQSLKVETTQTSQIIFNSFSQMLRTKKLFNSISYNIKNSNYWTSKLFNEINYQFKNEVISSLKYGLFNKDTRLLFPRITAFEYDPIEFEDYKIDLFHILDIRNHEFYSDNNSVFTLKSADYSQLSSNSMELFIPFNLNKESPDGTFSDISYLSLNYIQALAPFWLMINVASLFERKIIELRKKTFTYIRKNQVTLFLRKTLNLKNKLSYDWINFERIRKDFSSDIFNRQLDFNGIPNAHNSSSLLKDNSKEFKGNLIQRTITVSTNIKNSFEEILELHKYVSEDSTARANMRLQRLLFWFAILGVLLGIYGVNSEWFNSWFEYYVGIWGIEFPTPPK